MRFVVKSLMLSRPTPRRGAHVAAGDLCPVGAVGRQPRPLVGAERHEVADLAVARLSAAHGLPSVGVAANLSFSRERSSHESRAWISWPPEPNSWAARAIESSFLTR